MKIKQIIDNKELLPTWDIEVPDYHYYLLKNGCVSHNSISMTFPNFLSTGIEPLMGYAYWRKTRALKGNREYSYFFVLPNTIKKLLLEKLTKGTEDYEFINNLSASIEDSDGKIGNRVIDILKNNINVDLLKPSHEIDPFAKVKLMAAAQKWITAAISVTFNVANDFTVEDTERLYMEAWENGLKSITIYRDGSREGIYIFEDPVTYNKKIKSLYDGSSAFDIDIRPKEIIYNSAPKRPNELPCDIHFTSIKGVQWIVLVGLLNSNPFEIFCGKNEDLSIHKSCKNGVIIKEKSGKYMLKIENDTVKFQFSNIADVLMTDNEKSITRTISLALRHGVPSQYIVQQLKKSGGDITAFSVAISRILSKYIGTYSLKEGEKLCPDCGNNSLVFSDGCISCGTDGCFYNRCE